MHCDRLSDEDVLVELLIAESWYGWARRRDDEPAPMSRRELAERARLVVDIARLRAEAERRGLTTTTGAKP